MDAKSEGKLFCMNAIDFYKLSFETP
jgi:hypothetical protein